MSTRRKLLVAYFSASGVTAKAAGILADAAGADLYEIKPKQPYSNADLDWMNKESRSSKEMENPASRPAIADNGADIEQYAAIFIGFPIWWYIAPTIINTFLESYDFSGKKVIPFATSGSSGLGKTADMLRPSCPDTTIWIPGKLLNGNPSKAKLEEWISSLNLY